MRLVPSLTDSHSERNNVVLIDEPPDAGQE